MKETAHLFQTDILSLSPLEFKMWTQRNPSNDVVELYELGNKRIMQWLQKYGFPEIKTKPHTQMDEWYEPRCVTCLNRPEENWMDEDEKEELKKKEAERQKELLNETQNQLKHDEEEAKTTVRDLNESK